jgi:glycosyltransferase involved in cell wall biosynthesis
MRTRTPPRVTVVVPAYNEAQTLAELVRRVFTVPDQSKHRFDLVIVDDGSGDATATVAKEQARHYPITLVQLARNFGKEAALLAGLDHASGDAVIIMDADLQHPASLIDEFLEHWHEGYDSVYALRIDRSDESFLKRALTRLFYGIINANSDVRIVPNALDFRLLDRKVVAALTSLRERVRFTKGLYAWVGYRSIGIPFVPAPREDGNSRFSIAALARLAWDGITSFSDLPLRLSAIVGVVVASLSVAYAVYIAVRTLIFGADVPGWATLTVATLFLSGLQMLFLGVIGEYIRNIYRETKHRPSYVVAELVPARMAALRLQRRRATAAAVELIPDREERRTGTDGPAA